MKEFERLGIIEPILKSIKNKGFEEPTPIQEKTIPLILKGKDIIGGSSTGSGKTLAFGTGIITNTEKGEGIQSLILTPTRELAGQVASSLKYFSSFKNLEIVEIYGGVSINPQIRKLKKADIVVGTPGRLLDHIKRRTIELRNVKVLVLDEADRMLDMGFIDDVKRIIDKCSKDRQTLLFSATINEDVMRIAKRYMNNPVKISVSSHVDPSKLNQVYFDVDKGIKFSLLVHLLNKEKKGLVMVFCNTRRTVDFVTKNLKLNGIEAHALHGGYSQDKRNNVLDSFHNSDKAHVLICTDVAARGLDIQGVTHIYNYDIPKTPKEYVHRVGRTARAGKEGMAVNLLSESDHDSFKRIHAAHREMNITKEERPYVEKVKMSRTEKKYKKPRYSHGSYKRRKGN